MSSPFDVHTPTEQSVAANPWLLMVVNNLPEAVLVEDDEAIIQIVNLQFCKLFDLKNPPEAFTGRPSTEIFTGLYRSFENADLFSERSRSLRAEKKAHSEVIHLKDGRIFSYSYAPLWQEQVFAGHLWSFTDETERVKAESVLTEQRNFYENVLNSIPSDIAVFSPEHQYLYINPVGLRDAELRKWLIGKTDFDYCMMRGKDISFAQNRREVFNDIIATGKEKEWEERIVNKKGEVEYHLRKLSPLYDDKKQLVWMIGYSVNITERKKIEEKIQFSEKRYRDLFDYSQAIICTHDMKGNFLSANPSLLEVLGYEQKEIMGKNLKEFLLPEDQSGFEDLYLSSIETNNKVKGVFRVIHKTGRKVYLLYQNYRVEESSDSEAYIIAFAQDVTDRIKAEKELKEAKKLTEETARNKEKFLANMSHEIRTPMNGIIGITSFLQKTQLTSEQRNYLNIVQESAHDLLTIINDILDLEKVGTGQIQLENIPFDIIAKTSTVIRLFELTAREKGINLVFENQVGPELCVTGDPTRFNQVLNNLVSNAVKFTHDGKIKVRVFSEKETAETITLSFAVEDTGIGIDPDNINKIFQPFTQAYPETTRKYGGTGLGLAITKNLLELQNGRIWVDSKPDHGSCFNFSIPFHKCTGSQKKLLEPTRTINNELGPLKILIAEDNEVNQLLTKGMLEHLHFRVMAANTGREVLQRLNEEDFNVILMDINMPEMNGFEATRQIRSLAGQKKNTPIIALTANALKGEEKNYITAGMNGYLAKPFTEAGLYQVISKVIGEQTSFPTNDQNMNQNPGPEATEKLYDLALVSDLARGNKDFIFNLAKIFIETVPPTAKEMLEACEQKKWEQMGKLAHKLKSTIDTMCINSLKDDIRAIEKNGKEKKELELTATLVQKADTVIGQVAQQLKSEFNL
jgi:PAS domain S-box-containing protein